MNQMIWTAEGAAGAAPGRREARSLTARLMSLAVNTLTVGAVLALVGSILLVVLVRQGPDGETSILGHPILEVASGSMTPTFDAGDLILDNPVSLSAAEHLHRGEVITFRSTAFTQGGAPILITHRIHKVIPGTSSAGVRYRTKGDANNVVDAGLVAPAAIVGSAPLRLVSEEATSGCVPTQRHSSPEPIARFVLPTWARADKCTTCGPNKTTGRHTPRAISSARARWVSCRDRCTPA